MNAEESPDTGDQPKGLPRGTPEQTFRLYRKIFGYEFGSDAAHIAAFRSAWKVASQLNSQLGELTIEQRQNVLRCAQDGYNEDGTPIPDEPESDDGE